MSIMDLLYWQGIGGIPALIFATVLVSICVWMAYIWWRYDL